MIYIDYLYYVNEYNGECVDEPDFPRYSKRAGEAIDAITSYRIKQNGLDSFTDFIIEQIKLAVAAQVEFYALNGIEIATDDEAQDFSVGKVSIINTNRKRKTVASKVYEALEPTGLLSKEL